MRYGIISDVHGNLEALQNVLARLEQEGAEQYAFLGDAVGYGANPNEACDLIRTVADFAVLGNHDAAVVKRMDYSEYYDAARRSLDWCRKQMSDTNMAWLADLPYKQRDGMVEFCHGAPVAPEQFDYLFSPEQVADLINVVDDLAEVTFIGHSHLTVSFEIAQDIITPMIVPRIQCKSDAKYIITAGSVGQPRDRDPRSCCGIFDSQTRQFDYFRVPYDTEAVRNKIIALDLDPIFGDRLLVGI